jgi:hypothetical protein
MMNNNNEGAVLFVAVFAVANYKMERERNSCAVQELGGKLK